MSKPRPSVAELEEKGVVRFTGPGAYTLAYMTSEHASEEMDVRLRDEGSGETWIVEVVE